MSFPYSAYGLAFVTAALASALSLPLWRAWCRRTGLVDDPGHRKIHDQPIPLAGGWAVMTGLLVPLLGAWVWLEAGWLEAHARQLLMHGFNRRSLQLAAILGGAVIMLLIGWIDDRYELRPAWKFAGQIVAALLVAATGSRVTLFVESTLVSYALTILWILTVTNALNFMDNMNGLCGGLGCIGALLFGLKAALLGQYLVASIAFLAAGALAGFLPFNFPRASVFLGDAGSHLVGYLLAVLAILPHFYTEQHPQHLAVGAPIVVLAVPLGDLVWVIVLRWRLGKPFYVGDTNHWSHRLVRRGWSKPQAVALIWASAALIGGFIFVL
jgi:UDP-GlcNAc:undecaprenyl-phosphate GlcNAc-1-phosphate transferase